MFQRVKHHRAIGAAHRSAFPSERALQLSLLDALSPSTDTHPVSFAKREVQVGSCIPDVVAVRYKRPPSTHLLPSRIAYRHAVVLSLLRARSPLRSTTIAARIHDAPLRIQPTIDELCAAGAILECPSGAFAIARELREDEPEVIAIEAKLSRWKEALAQAESYRHFANYVVIALDAARLTRPTDASAASRRRRVGLCCASPESTLWLVEPARNATCHGPAWEYLVQTAAMCTAQRAWTSR